MQTPILTNDQLDSIISNYAEIVVDGMDHKTMYRAIYDNLVDYYSGISQDELQDFVDQHDPDLWKELVDNEIYDEDNEITTYSLEPGESLSFPVHKSAAQDS